MGAGAGAGGGPDGVVALGSGGGGLLATGGGGGILPAAGRGEGVPETGAPQLRQNLDAGFNSAPQRAQTGLGGGVSPSMRFPQLSQKSSPSVMGSPQYLQNFGMGLFSSLSGPFRLRGRDAVHGFSVSCRECSWTGLECSMNSVLRGIWWTGMMVVGWRGGSRRMEWAQAFAPLREGGVSWRPPCIWHSRDAGAGFTGAHGRIPWTLFGFPDWWGEPSGRTGPAFHAARRGRLAPPIGRVWDGAESPGIWAMLFWKPL